MAKKGGRQAAQHTAQEIAGELGNVSDLLKSQVEAGLQESEVVEMLFKSWQDRLQNMSQPKAKRKLC